MRVDTVRSISGDRIATSPNLRHGSDVAHPSFTEELKSSVKSVNERHLQADQAMATAATDGPNKIHETMIQLEEAEISTRLLLKLRTKALDAYQEIMRMQF